MASTTTYCAWGITSELASHAPPPSLDEVSGYLIESIFDHNTAERHVQYTSRKAFTSILEVDMKHFIVTISFKVPTVSIGEHILRQHLALLQQGYESGYILMYGPREPEDGTIAIARVESRQVLGSALAVDPLLTSGLAAYDFMEFIPVRFPTSLQGWVDPMGFHPPPTTPIES